jgi:hypothetical protein
MGLSVFVLLMIKSCPTKSGLFAFSQRLTFVTANSQHAANDPSLRSPVQAHLTTHSLVQQQACVSQTSQLFI